MSRLTNEQWTALDKIEGVCHNLGSLTCWCKPTLSEDIEHLILTHHYSPEARQALEKIFPEQKEFGVVRVPKSQIQIALAMAGKMSSLYDEQYNEH